MTQALDMPDGPGWYAWEWGNEKGVSEVYDGWHGELRCSDEPGGLDVEYFTGRKWYRLTMPWDAPTAQPATNGEDDNGGRRWWRMNKDGHSQPWCIDIADMEHFWLKGWRPEYPLQTQPLDTSQPASVPMPKTVRQTIEMVLHFGKRVGDTSTDVMINRGIDEALAWLQRQGEGV